MWYVKKEVSMKTLFAGTLLAACILPCMAQAQNTGATATPQTQGAAPAGLNPGTTAAKPSAASRGGASRARRQGQGGTPAAQGNTSTPGNNGGASGTPQGQAGITGVPAYDPGSSRQTNTPAPAATGRITVTGDNDGDGVPDRRGSGLEDGAPLPGVSLLHNALGIPPGTPMQVKLRQTIDSGRVKNGQMVEGTLAAPLGRVPAGAPVQLTVVAVAKAGEISSRGELSLQVVSVNGEQALSEVITAEGKEGTKILPDDAPARGTEAIFTADQTITLPAS